MNYDKKKDENPLRTITKIREILGELGIFTTETWKDCNGIQEDNHLYSMRVNAPAYGFGTNGKGTTRLYTLASAYGEFMERLENLIIFPMSSLTEEALEKGGFAYFPDEVKLSLADIIRGEDAFTRTVFDDFYSDSPWMLQIGSMERTKAVHTFMGNLDKSACDTFIGWPFYSVRKKETFSLWTGFITALTGSNGMSAGNTPQEALVQGLSEIFERYASIEIMKKQLVPPEIPQEEYEVYPSICDMITEIENMGPFKILIKDCSLGLDLPVCAVVLLDYEMQRYRVSFGGHPSLPVVLERCLTELLQGYDLRTEKGRKVCLTPLEKWNYEPNLVDTYINIKNQHMNGQGEFPHSFFAGVPSYGHQPYKDFSSADNSEMLQYLLTTALSLSEDVLIRDVSYLGFPAYFIIVPGMSHYRTDWKTFQIEASQTFLQGILRKNDIQDCELKKLLTSLNLREQYTVKEKLPWDVRRLKLAVLFQLENYESCIQYINTLLPWVQDAVLCRELKAIHYIVCLLKEGKSPSEFEKTVRLFFGADMWEYLKVNWLSGCSVKTILQEASSDSNLQRQIERKQSTNMLFCRIKNQFAKKTVEQKALGDIITPLLHLDENVLNT